jgi:hypothetical protein
MIGAAIFKGFISLVALAIGAVAGGAIVLAALDIFGINFGLMDWVLALLGAVVGVILIQRYKEWAFIALAALVGALLTVRGLQMFVPFVQGLFASLLGLVLAGISFTYHGGLFKRRIPATQ